MSDIKLLPCPFCGVVPKFERVEGRRSDPNGSEFWGIICRSGRNVGGACEVSVPPRRTKESAGESWNNRATNTVAHPVAWLVEVDGMTLHHREPMDHPRAKNAPLFTHPIEVAGLEATVAQQAKMIENLRGGPTPLYTAVDMANAARDGFRDGAASKSEPCDACFMAEAEALRKDAALGRVAIKFIDRLCDPAGSDPLEKIVEEYTAAFREAMSKEG